MATSFAQHRERRLGLSYEASATLFFRDLANGVREAAEALGMSVLVLERVAPSLYRRARTARSADAHLSTLCGVRWAVPPAVETVQGPYCTTCPDRLRGVLWAGDAGPTLWACPSCGREFSTPKFPDIAREAARQLAAMYARASPRIPHGPFRVSPVPGRPLGPL